MSINGAAPVPAPYVPRTFANDLNERLGQFNSALNDFVADTNSIFTTVQDQRDYVFDTLGQIELPELRRPRSTPILEQVQTPTVVVPVSTTQSGAVPPYLHWIILGVGLFIIVVVK